MRYYLMTPDHKKSMVEYTRFTKEIDGIKTHLVKEEGYRGGSFVVKVPETLGELDDWLKEREITFDEAVESYGADFTSWPFLPTADLDWIDVDDYDHEFLQAHDGCWSDWVINQYTSIDAGEEGVLSVEQKDEMLDKIYDIYDEEYEEGIEADGWDMRGCYWEIHCTVSLEESDEYGNILDEGLEDDD